MTTSSLQRFVICWSQLQAAWDNIGAFHVFGSSGEPWLSARLWFWEEKRSVDLWGYFLTARYLPHFCFNTLHIFVSTADTLDTPRVVWLGRLENPTLDFWYHICLDIDTAGNKVAAAINGVLVGDGIDLKDGIDLGDLMAKEMTNHLSGNLVVGKWNYTFEGEEEQFVGSVTNLAIFSGTKPQDLAALTNDLCNVQGDFLSWDNLGWKVEGKVAEQELSNENVCRQKTSYSLLIAEPMGQLEAVATCAKLGHGRMVEAAREEEIRQVVSWVEGRQGDRNCSFLWTPFSDQATEGTFVNIETGKEQRNLAWKPRQPSGRSTENSLRIDMKSKLIEDEKEADGDCFVCKLQRSFTARLRGGCEETKLERLFYLENDKFGMLRYVGWMGSIITYHGPTEVWEIRHFSSPSKIFGNINASSESLSLGLHQWSFTEDTDQ